jgi:L-ascorbate metabolism protein UlaG (beta-lactamase superfamily)
MGDDMDITFYAHACFRLQGDRRVVITDPYTPGSQGSGFEPINEPADIVIMSSATDRFHASIAFVAATNIASLVPAAC